jgi:hypothetical protein
MALIGRQAHLSVGPAELDWWIDSADLIDLDLAETTNRARQDVDEREVVEIGSIDIDHATVRSN